jgi:hypothetical protein
MAKLKPPDSRSIGFFVNDTLSGIDVDGGSLRALARAPVGRSRRSIRCLRRPAF